MTHERFDVLISDGLEMAEGCAERSWTNEEIYLGRVTLRRVVVWTALGFLEGHMP